MNQNLSNYQKNKEQILTRKKEQKKMSKKERDRWERDLWTRV